jgi:hypothetical protein
LLRDCQQFCHLRTIASIYNDFSGGERDSNPAGPLIFGVAIPPRWPTRRSNGLPPPSGPEIRQDCFQVLPQQIDLERLQHPRTFRGRERPAGQSSRDRIRAFLVTGFRAFHSVSESQFLR